MWPINPAATNNIPNQDVVEAFNWFFVKKVREIRSSLGHALMAQDYPLPAGSSELGHFAPPTEKELKEILPEKEKKLYDLDPIQSCMIKENTGRTLPHPVNTPTMWTPKHCGPATGNEYVYNWTEVSA